MGVIITKNNCFRVLVVVCLLVIQGEGQAKVKCCKTETCDAPDGISECDLCLLKTGKPDVTAGGCAPAAAIPGCEVARDECTCKDENCNKDTITCEASAKCNQGTTSGPSSGGSGTPVGDTSAVNHARSSSLILVGSVILSGVWPILDSQKIRMIH